MLAYGELMPTNDELHAADLEQARAIAALEARATGHDNMLAQHTLHLHRHDEQIAAIRETLGGLATKGDILDLRRDISTFNEQQMRDAHNSIPAKFGMICAGGMFLLTALAFGLAHFH
jgi:predicted  nucleic acid-binding Zn-ribbon protein